jgi:hypothetical protein
MFCPECRVEYRPGFTRCSDCDVPLIEHLPATPGDSKRTQVSGATVLKEWGVVIVLLPMLLATMLVFVALRDNPFEVQIASITGYTGCVFFFVFCDAGPGHSWSKRAKGTKGFSLGEQAVRQKLPLLMCIHTGSLLVLFAGVTGAMRLRPHTWSLWHLDTNYFDCILLFTAVAVAFAQVHFLRRLLGRALEDEQKKRPSLTFTT